MIHETITSWWATGALLPILIFLSRIVDVSMGTIRIIFVSRGVKALSAVLGFFEVLIWLVAITQIMKHLTSPWHYVAYAAGFGMGNFVGISIEQKLRIGTLMLRIITRGAAAELIAELRQRGLGVTTIDAQGATGPVKMIFTVLRRKDLDGVLAVVEKLAGDAFYTVEEVKEVAERDLMRGKPITDIPGSFQDPGCCKK